MGMFDKLAEDIESQVSKLYLEYDELEFAGGRINGYRVAPAVYAALYEFITDFRVVLAYKHFSPKTKLRCF
jgi:hypothetical protein